MRILHYEEEMLKKARGKGRLPLPLLSLGLWLSDRLRAGRRPSIRETRFDDLLLRSREELRFAEAQVFARILLILAAGGLLTGLLALRNRNDSDVRELLRPAFGKQNTVQLLTRIDGEEEKLTVSVSGQDPSEEEMEKLFDEAVEELKESCLGDNASMDRVHLSLSLPSESDLGIRFSYESLEPELLSDTGILLADAFPEEGLPAELRVTASYGAYEKEYLLSFVLREEELVLSPLEKLEQAVKAADEEQKSEACLSLPLEVEGMTVSYRNSRLSPWLPCGMALILAVLLFFLPKQKEKEKEKARETELALSYTQLLSKLNTLIHAGMSIRSAWTRIVKEYREGEASGERKREYAYEEMFLALRRMEQGENEGEAYEEFGKRCGLRSYRKLGNLLGQNLRQGIAGLEGTLEEEMEKALEERKNRALRAGEEAGTKLLFPMILMLGIVVVTLVVPAFLAF